GRHLEEGGPGGQGDGSFVGSDLVDQQLEVSFVQVHGPDGEVRLTVVFRDHILPGDVPVDGVDLAVLPLQGLVGVGPGHRAADRFQGDRPVTHAAHLDRDDVVVFFEGEVVVQHTVGLDVSADRRRVGLVVGPEQEHGGGLIGLHGEDACTVVGLVELDEVLVGAGEHFGVRLGAGVVVPAPAPVLVLLLLGGVLVRRRGFGGGDLVPAVAQGE